MQLKLTPKDGGGKPYSKRLSPKMRAFLDEYVVDFNKRAAMVRAGYGGKVQSRDRMHKHILALPAAQEYLNTILAERRERLAALADRTLEETAAVAFANMLDYVVIQPDGTAYVDLSKITREQGAAIASVKVAEYFEGKGEAARPVKATTFELHAKVKALEMMGKHFGLFGDKLELSGSVDLGNRILEARKRLREQKQEGWEG